MTRYVAIAVLLLISGCKPTSRESEPNKIDPQQPKRFATTVDVRFTETWNPDGHVRTGAQVLDFSDEIVAKTPGIMVHWFQFEYDSVLYEFKLAGSQTVGINTDADMTVMIDPSDLSKCWMNGHELVAHPWEPDDE